MNNSGRVLIVSGNFTQKGNFSGYDENGERYFIHSRLIASTGWKADKDVQFPFWTTGVKERTVNMMQVNADGTLSATDETITRTQAGAIFKTTEDLVKVAVMKASADIEIASAVHKFAVESGLSKETADKLELTSVF